MNKQITCSLITLACNPGQTVTIVDATVQRVAEVVRVARLCHEDVATLGKLQVCQRGNDVLVRVSR